MRGDKRNLAGHKFGRLTVVEEAEKIKGGRVLWRCNCECGNEHTVNGDSLRRGLTKSCGCIRRDNARQLFGKYTKSQIDEFITRVAQTYENYSQNWLKTKGTDEDRRLCEASQRFYGTWNNALNKNGFKPVRSASKRFKSSDEVKKQYMSDYRSGVNRGDIKYRQSIEKYFGSLDNLDSILGIKRGNMKPSRVYEIPELDKIILEIRRRRDVEFISAKYLDGVDVNIAYSIRKHYGSITAYFSQLDIDFYDKPYVPFKWDAENTKRQLLRWIREGKPVNYTRIAQSHDGIIVAARKIYGGWEELFKACGLDYEDFRVDTDMASYFGYIFEDLVAEIFTELGVGYVREPQINDCRPDFVLNDGSWVDAKLSQWTIHLSDCDTISKYEPHCDKLLVIFLRGDKDIDKEISNKTRLISVYKLLTRLPDDRRRFYLRKFEEMQSELTSNIA